MGVCEYMCVCVYVHIYDCICVYGDMVLMYIHSYLYAAISSHLMPLLECSLRHEQCRCGFLVLLRIHTF